MITAPALDASSTPFIDPFREDGTFRLDPALAPGRHRPRELFLKKHPDKDPANAPKKKRGMGDAAMWNRMLTGILTGEKVPKQQIPSERSWDRGRQLAIMGDPLADDFAALYPKLGYPKARAMLDLALDQGIEHVKDAPEALKALFAEVDNPPEWVNWDRVERGANAMRRYAPFTWLFARLAFAQTYVNANAGMPLYMTGSLGEATVAKRLKETSRWRLGIQQPGALRRSGDGFKTVVKVRVLHALVRYHLFKFGKWDAARFGMPIPQLDMAGANIGMFMTHSYMLAGLGMVMTPREFGDVMHLWRYHGHLIGVVDDLNPKSFADLGRIGTLMTLTTRTAFDKRARALTRSTMNARLREGEGWLGNAMDYVDVRVSHGLYQLSNGRKLYELMELGDERKWLWFLPAVLPAGLAADTLRRLTPGGTKIAERLGGRYIDRIMQVDEVKNAPFRPYHMSA